MRECRFLLLFLLVLIGVSAHAVAESNYLSDVAYLKGEYVSDTLPDTLSEGISQTYDITYTNSGLAAWESRIEKVGVLVRSEPPDLLIEPSFIPVPDNSKVLSNNHYRFSFRVTPHKSGSYQLLFQMNRRVQGVYEPVSDTFSRTIQVRTGSVERRPETGSVQITTPGVSYQAYLDGEMVGRTPVLLPGLRPGDHDVRISGDGIERRRTVQVSPGSVTEVSINPSDPVIHVEYTSPSFLDTNSSILSLILSNIYLLFGLMGILVLTALAAILAIARKKSRMKFTLEQHAPRTSLLSRVNKIVTGSRTGSHKNAVVFQPMAAICTEGDECRIRVQFPDFRGQILKIDNDVIQKKSAECIEIRVSTSIPGEQTEKRVITYLDDEGKRHQQEIVLSYLVQPSGQGIDLSFRKFFCKNNRIYSAIRVKNRSKLSLLFDGATIAAGTDRDIFVAMEEPDLEDPDLLHDLLVSVQGEEKHLQVRIPYNKGIFFFLNKRYADALSYFKGHLQSHRDDAYAWYQQGVVYEISGDHENAQQSYQKAISLNSGLSEASSALKRLQIRSGAGEPTLFVPDETPPLIFPEELLRQYHPLEHVVRERSGDVFKVQKIADGAPRLLKVLTGESLSSSVELQLSAWKTLKNENILRLYGWGIDPVPFLEMESVNEVLQYNKQVSSLSEIRTPIPLPAAIKIALSLAEGLGYIHRQGVRHYHLEPSAIYLTKPLKAKIGGFDNLPLFTADPSSVDAWVLAPEQKDPDHYGKIGKKTDIYQFGALFYYLVTSQLPEAISYGSSPVLPSQIYPKLRLYDDIMRKCLAVEKQDRYGTMEEVISALRDLQEMVRQHSGGRVGK